MLAHGNEESGMSKRDSATVEWVIANAITETALTTFVPLAGGVLRGKGCRHLGPNCSREWPPRTEDSALANKVA